MPKKSLKDYTDNELQYKKIVDFYNAAKNKRWTRYQKSIDVDYLANSYELCNNNLGYYRRNGTVDEAEEEEFEKLKTEEKYYQDLNVKYKAYLRKFDEYYESYQKVKELQGKAIELERASSAADKINSDAKEKYSLESFLLSHKEEVKGLREAGVKYYDDLHDLGYLERDIRDFEKKEVLQNRIKETLDAFHQRKDLEHQEEEKQRKIDEEIRKKEAEAKAKEDAVKQKILDAKRAEEEKIAEEKRKEEEKIAEEKRKQDEIKAKEEAEKQKAIKEKKNEVDTLERIKKGADEGIIYEKDREFLNNLAKKLNIDEKFNDSTKKYTVNGFEDQKLSLKEAYNACRQGYAGYYGSLEVETNALHRADNVKNLGLGFEAAKNKFKDQFINEKEIIDKKDKANPKKYTQNEFVSLKNRSVEVYAADRYFKELCKDAVSYDGVPSPQQYAEIIGYVNQFAQMHHSAKEPGFLSKLFNTNYNKSYKAEKEILEGFRKDLTKLDFSEDFINQITDKETCRNTIEKEQVYNQYNEKYVKDTEDIDLVKQAELAEIKAFTAVVYDAYYEKNPVESLNDYLDKLYNHVDYDNSNAKEENATYLDKRKEEFSQEMSKGFDNRIPLEVRECKNEIQGIEENSMENNEKELSIEKEENMEMDSPQNGSF